MADPYLAIIDEHWDKILMMYDAFKDQKPIIEYDLHDQKIYAYPAKEYIQTLSRRTRQQMEAQYTKALRNNQFILFVKDPKNEQLRSYLFDLPSESFDDECFYTYAGQCQACDRFGELNDFGLCDECADKLERDLIRQRDWDYSGLAFGLSSEQREEARRQVISQFGEQLELISPTPPFFYHLGNQQ